MSLGRFILLVVAIGAAIVALLLWINTDWRSLLPEDEAAAPSLDARSVLGTPLAATGDSDTIGVRRVAPPEGSGATGERRVAAPVGGSVPDRSRMAQPVGVSTSGRQIGEPIAFADPDRRASAVGATLLARIPGPSNAAEAGVAGDVAGTVGRSLKRPSGMDLMFGSLMVLDEGTNELVRYAVGEPAGPVVEDIYPLDPKRLADSPYVHWDQVEVDESIVYVSGRPAMIVDFSLSSNSPLLAYFPDDFDALAMAVTDGFAWVATPKGMLTYDVTEHRRPFLRMDQEFMLPRGEGVGAAVSAVENVFAFRHSDLQDVNAFEFHEDGRIYIHSGLELDQAVDGFESHNPPSIAYHDRHMYVTHAGGLEILREIDGHLPTLEPDASIWSYPPDYSMVASWPTDWPATHVYVDWPYVALSDTHNTYVLDATDLTDIEEVARYYHGAGGAGEMGMSMMVGSRLYVLNSATGVHILELDVR